MRVIKTICFVLISSCLVGCAYMPKTTIFQDRNKEYLSAKSIKPLRIPPGVSSEAFSNDYPIPEREDTFEAKNVSIVPPDLYP